MVLSTFFCSLIVNPVTYTNLIPLNTIMIRLFFFIASFSLVCFFSFGGKIDTTLLTGNWKLHYYHLYTPLQKSKNVDTIIHTSGHVYLYKDHTYETEDLKMCFLDANDYTCPTSNGGKWHLSAPSVLTITWDEKKLRCLEGCPEPISRHGVYIIKLTEEVLVLRTEYYDKKRKERFVLDAYLVRKVE